MRKLVILDGYTENPGDLSWSDLKSLGDLTVYDRTPPDLMASRIGGADAAFVNKAKISRETMDACPNLRYIGVLATGYDCVDVAAAQEKGIVVTNIPTYGTGEVSQFVFALLLEICHHAYLHAQAVAEGRWASCPDWCFWDYPLISLANKTMGIVGFGRIGKRTGSIAKAMGMNVLAYDSFINDEGKAIADYVDLDTLLAQSDVIVLHCPLTASNQGMINEESIAKMKDGVILINNSRGPLIVEEDLAEALNSGKVYAAGIDVVSVEPPPADFPLLHAKNCLITPHISWAPKESRIRIMAAVVENYKQFLAGRPINVVSMKK